MNWLWLCYLAVCQLLSKLGAISSLAHITIRNMKAGLAREERKLVTLKHDMNYVKRKDGLLLNQQVNHTFFSIMFPWKDQICIWSTTTLNLQGEKSILCAESSLGESCSSNYRHCLPKPSAVAFITPGRAAAELGGEEETQASQQPQPGCTGKLRHWCDPKRTDVLVIHTSLSCRCSWCSPSRGNRGTHILFRSKEIRRPSSSQTKQAQWEVSGQNLIPQMRKFVLWSQSEQPNFHSPHTSPPRGDANDMARIIEKELNPSLTSTCRLHPDLHTFMLMTPASADCFHQHRYR